MFKNKRKQLLINPSLQIKFVLFSSFIGIFCASVVYTAAYIVFRNYKSAAITKGILPNSIYIEYLDKQMWIITSCFLFLIPLFLLFTIFFGLKFSNQIAGPIFNLSNSLKEMNNTNSFNEVKLREGDYFQELEIEINQLILKIKK